MTLLEAIPGIKYEIVTIIGPNRNRLSEMGFNPGCEISVCSKNSEEYRVVNCRGFKIGLRKEETQCILITELSHDEV
jgi:Fe2+ transport system protein FeoA